MLKNNKVHRRKKIFRYDHISYTIIYSTAFFQQLSGSSKAKFRSAKQNVLRDTVLYKIDIGLQVFSHLCCMRNNCITKGSCDLCSNESFKAAALAIRAIQKKMLEFPALAELRQNSDLTCIENTTDSGQCKCSH